jgi:hypothetical protein
LEALSDKEIVVTLNNWNVQSAKGATIKVLEKHINPYLAWYWESKGIKLDGNAQPINKWQSTHLSNTFKLLLYHSDLAHSARCSTIAKNVQQVDCMGNVYMFRFEFQKFLKEGLANYFSQYALCDGLPQRVGASRAAARSKDIGDWECP